MRIVVTAPTGNVGSRVVQLLLQAGVRPTLLARDPARLDPGVLERADVVRTDLADSDAVVQATRGADALFWLAPMITDPEADPVAWYAKLGATAARAVTENGIARTVFISSIGAEQRTGVGEIDGLASTEEFLGATGSSVLFLRCGYFYTNLDLDSLRHGVVRIPAAVDYAQPWVDPRDIGDIAAARLLYGGWSGRNVQAVHGPEDLTLIQVAQILTEALGRPIRAETISQDALRASLRAAGFGDKQIEGMVGMSAVMRSDFIPEDKRGIVTTTPTTLAAWAHARLRPLLQAESAT
ncbi:MAG TPA: NAD(P)H-binding protein [Streptosporangiaceae bacterium]|nr:NAD(P)H-binding protein [Streptosporangiaceae bacterium]